MGGNIIEALPARGERKITVFDITPSTLFEADVAKGLVKIVIGSITDAARVAEAMQGVDVCIHTAAAVNFWYVPWARCMLACTLTCNESKLD